MPRSVFGIYVRKHIDRPHGAIVGKAEWKGNELRRKVYVTGKQRRADSERTETRVKLQFQPRAAPQNKAFWQEKGRMNTGRSEGYECSPWQCPELQHSVLQRQYVSTTKGTHVRPGYKVVWTRRQIPTFRRNTTPPSSGFNHINMYLSPSRH
jgi:hypothetical protein